MTAILPANVASAASQVVETAGMGGVFTAPTAGRYPCVVIVPGSGPTDRDGNNPFGVTARPYALLAGALLAEGVATLRYNKRLPGTTEAERALTIDAAATDAGQWLRWCRDLPDVTAVYLLGHSEGGLIALDLARRQPVSGVILLATPGKPVAELIMKQLARASDAQRSEAASILARLDQGQSVDAVAPELAPLFRPSVQPFLRSLMALDPQAMARALVVPLLVIAGGRDLQVPVVDAQPGGDALILPAMNHVLKDVSDDDADNLAAYREPERPLAAGLVAAIAAFIRRH